MSNQEDTLLSRNETIQKVQSSIWDAHNSLRGSFASIDRSNVTNFAAYIALVMGETGTSETGDVTSAIKERLGDGFAYEYVASNIGDSWVGLAAALRERFTDDELRDLVLYYDGNERYGKAAGQFSTPESISKLALSVLDVSDGQSVADLGCGGGSFLLDASLARTGLSLYGIDINEAVAALAFIRCSVAGADFEIVLGDMFEAEIPKGFDRIFSNFPIGMRPSFMRGEGKYYEAMRTGKGGIGRPASADWMFNKLVFDSLAEDGIGVTIMTNGAAFNGGDKQARRYFVNNGMIRAVVALPANLFPTTAIPFVLLVLGKNDGDIRMVDASELSVSGRRWDTMGDDEISATLDRIANDGDSSRLVSKDELAATEYNLFPSRYLGRSIELENATPLGDLAQSIERGSGLTAKDLDALTVDEDTGLSYLRLSDITDGCIGDDLPHLRELDPKTEKQWLRTGDLIVSKNGAPFKITVADVPEGQTIMANGNLYIIRLDTNRINPYFAAAFLASDNGKELMDRMVVGTTIPNLPLRNLKDIELPVPPMDEQEEVARRYQARLDEIEVLKIKLEKARVGAAGAYDEVMGR